MRTTTLCLLLVCAEACGAQSHYRPSEPWAVNDAGPPRWYEARPGELYRPAWEYVRACSQLPEKRGGRYEDVHWLVVSPGGLRNEKGQQIIGVWLTPDTIVIDSLWTEAGWLVAHELLHHRRQVSGEKDPHPHVPFTYPCMLMYFQNVPGGIMAGRYARPPRIKDGAPVELPGGSVPLRFIGQAVRKHEGEP